MRDKPYKQALLLGFSNQIRKVIHNQIKEKRGEGITLHNTFVSEKGLVNSFILTTTFPLLTVFITQSHQISPKRFITIV
jgi:hypothetical protein